MRKDRDKEKSMGVAASDNGGPLSKVKGIVQSLDARLAKIFIPWAIRNPRYIRSFRSLCTSFKFTERQRIAAIEQGGDLRVPPFLILSITSRCNLSCQGCFAEAVGTRSDVGRSETTRTPSHLSLVQWTTILQEASDLGVFGFVLAGGEPLLYPDLLELCDSFKDRLFIIVTNGTAFTDEHYGRLKKLGNVVVLVSIEGGPEITDERRGKGVHEKSLQTIARLKRIGVLFGISVTITKNTYRYWMQRENFDELIGLGVRIGAFIEYIPLTPPPSETINDGNGIEVGNGSQESDHHLVLSPLNRKEFRETMLHFRRTKNIYIIHSPGDEEVFGGCVSAGRGFAHITPRGDLTPCPVSNIATHNLTRSSLQEALSSRLFHEIRENEHLLETEGMPCALFAHPLEVDALAHEVGAYRTNITVRH